MSERQEKAAEAKLGADRARAVRTGALIAVLVFGAVWLGCDGSTRPARQPGRPASSSSNERAASPGSQATAPDGRRERGAKPGAAGAERRAPRPEVAGLTPAMRAAAMRPVAGPTGLFIDRSPAADVRVMTYNVNWDSIFPSKNEVRAERFQRIIRAVDPDVLALQEIRKSAEETAALLDGIAPRPGGELWYAVRGKAGVIASRFPLASLSTSFDPRTYREPAIAIVDLPDERCDIDLCVISNHFKCCGDSKNDAVRQRQADGVMNWLRDARQPGGMVHIAFGTGLVIVGDLNLVGGPQPLTTLLTGDIDDEAEFGSDYAPDWDETTLTDVHPLHNSAGPDDYTWRSDDSDYEPGRLDYVVYSDSVLEAVNGFVLNTMTMSSAELARCGLEALDCCEDPRGRELDHLPVVVDFGVRRP